MNICDNINLILKKLFNVHPLKIRVFLHGKISPLGNKIKGATTCTKDFLNKMA